MSKAQKEKENCESVIHVLMWWSNQDYFVGVFIPYSIREDTSSPMIHDPAMAWAQPPVVDTCRPTMAWKRHPIPTLPLLWLIRLGAYYKPWHSSLYPSPSSLHVRNSHRQESSPTCLFIMDTRRHIITCNRCPCHGLTTASRIGLLLLSYVIICSRNPVCTYLAITATE